MGRMKRATAFVVAAARKLAKEDPSAASALPEPLLERAIGDLPPGKLRGALESDLPRFVALFGQEVKEMLESVESEALPADNLLEISAVTNRDYRGSIEGLIRAAEKRWCSATGLEGLTSSCRKLLGCRPDAPLGLWWTYAALELHSLALEREHTSSTQEGDREKLVLHTISSAKVLLQRFRGLTTNPFATVAAMAPVVAALYEAGSLLVSWKTSPSRSKSWRNAVKLLETACREVVGIVAVYTSMQRVKPTSSFESQELDFRGLVLAGKGLTKLTGVESTEGKGVAKLFPMASKTVRKSLLLEGGEVEGVVAAEALLLRITVSILKWSGKDGRNLDRGSHEFLEHLKFLAVHGADMLVDTLLEPILPVEHILSTNEELFLRGILYDVVLTNPPRLTDLCRQGKASFILFLKKIGLAQRAIPFYRSQGERTKAVDLSSRLPSWNVPTGFPQWLQPIQIDKKPSDQTLSDPRALIGWLANLEEDAIASILASGAPKQSRKEQEPALMDTEEAGAFFVDTKGDVNVEDELDADRAFASAAGSMKEDHLKETLTDEGGNESASGESDDEEAVEEDDTGHQQPDEFEIDRVDVEPATAVGEDILDGLRHDMEADEGGRPALLNRDEAAISCDLEVPKVSEAAGVVDVTDAAEVARVADIIEVSEADVYEVTEVQPAESELVSPASPAEVAKRDSRAGEREEERMESDELPDQETLAPGTETEECQKQKKPKRAPKTPRTKKTARPPVASTPKTPTTTVVGTPQSLPAVRCTRSGKKYGDFVQQSLPASTKRRKVAKDAVIDLEAPEGGSQ